MKFKHGRFFAFLSLVLSCLGVGVPSSPGQTYVEVFTTTGFIPGDGVDYFNTGPATVTMTVHRKMDLAKYNDESPFGHGGPGEWPYCFYMIWSYWSQVSVLTWYTGGGSGSIGVELPEFAEWTIHYNSGSSYESRVGPVPLTSQGPLLYSWVNSHESHGIYVVRFSYSQPYAPGSQSPQIVGMVRAWNGSNWVNIPLSGTPGAWVDEFIVVRNPPGADSPGSIHSGTWYYSDAPSVASVHQFVGAWVWNP